MVDQKAETTANHLDNYWASMTARTKVELLGYSWVGCWVVTTVRLWVPVPVGLRVTLMVGTLVSYLAAPLVL